MLDHRLQRGRFGATVLDGRVVQLVGQPVAAQQQQFVRRQPGAQEADIRHLPHLPQALQNDVATGVLTRLLGAHPACIYHGLDPTVVVSELLDMFATDAIGAAVADPGQLELLPVQTHGNQGAAHASLVRNGLRRRYDCQMGGLHRSRQRLALLHGAHQFLQRQGTGHLTTRVPAHAIGQRPQPQIGTAGQGILVMRAYLAGNALRSEHHGYRGRLRHAANP